jgi:hypothetical protein
MPGGVIFRVLDCGKPDKIFACLADSQYLSLFT